MATVAGSRVPALAEGWQALRKIDAHMHVAGPGHGDIDNALVIEAADHLGIDQMLCSVPIGGCRLASMDEVRACNDAMIRAMRDYPDRILGYCFLIPGYFRESLQELDRCLDAGMIGIKLYNQYKYGEPVLNPLAEAAIEHGIPILGHAGHLTDAPTRAAQPRTSDALDFVELARRYPEVMLIEGHIGGGGDWEWTLKALRDCPNVYLDTSGSVINDNMVERCVQELGVERVLFATDLSMEAGVGKVLAADLNEDQLQDVLWRNTQRILDRSKA